MRGLKVSELLGCGFSCNGNAVAYLAGSPAPLSAYGLSREQLWKKAFHERPGPSISTSYTSSLGFTIQVHKCLQEQKLDSIVKYCTFDPLPTISLSIIIFFDIICNIY